MSRHRNIRNISVEDELSDDVYGRSLDEMDNYCISPATEAEFMFRRDKNHTLSSFIGDESKIDEEEEGCNQIDEDGIDEVTDYKRPQLDPISQAKLQSCIEQLEDILGESYQEDTIVDAILYHDYSVEKALDQLLNKGPAVRSNAKSSKLAYYTSGDNSFVLDTSTSNSHLTQSPKPNYKNGSKFIDDSRNSSGSSTPKSASRSQSKENLVDEIPTTPSSGIKTPKCNRSKEIVDISVELQKRSEGKQLINLVVIGHVDAGKSTLMGHLLYKLGNVSKRAMHKNEVDSKKSGKGSFAFAWVLDETEEERTRGITMDVAMTMFETKTKLVMLMDAPGHRDFIPNMLQGTAQADVAILVVDSRVGEFEAGFEAGGQTREHAILARSLGVGQLVVAVNKMDSIDWNKERYDNIVIKLKTFLTKQAGFRECDVFYIPCSGLSGENLVEGASESQLTSWYQGECLVERIDTFSPPERPVDKPFRLCVSDIYKGQGSFIVAGKVESGSVQNGDRVILMPAAEPGIVKALTSRDEPVKFAIAGDHVTASLHGVDINHISVGNIICNIDHPIKVSTRISTRIVVFNIAIPITKGFMVVFHSQNMSEPATVSKLVSILNKNTGDLIQRRPRCLTKHMNAVIEIKFSRPVCVEMYRDNKVLGRFMLRYSGKTIAAGVISEIK